MAVASAFEKMGTRLVRESTSKVSRTALSSSSKAAVRAMGQDALELSSRRSAGHTMTVLIDGQVAKTVTHKAPGVVQEREGKVVRTMLANFPMAMQHNNYTCGVGSTQAVMGWFRLWEYQDTIGKLAGTTAANGTSPKQLVSYINKYAREGKQQLRARVEEDLTIDDLKRHIDAGRPVIIDYQAWHGKPHYNYSKEWEDGHWSVVTGYDNQGRIYLMDPSGALGQKNYLQASELKKRWRDYEIEGGKRRNYVNSGIVVEGKHKPIPRFAHTD